jgi:hypothetical protein
MPFWNATSTTLANNEMYVNNTYKNANGTNALTTKTTSNPGGYTFVNSSSTDPIVKSLAYSVQTDGKITYLISGSNKEYKSIQDIAEGGIFGYNNTTTALIKNEMQKNLTASYQAYNTANPTKPIGPSTSSAAANPQTAADIATQDVDSSVTSAQNNPINISIPSEGVRKNYGPTLYYPTDLASNGQDRIVFTMKRQEGSIINATIDPNKKTIEKRTTTKIEGAVYLPIQPSISDNNTVDWSGGTLNAIQAFGAAASFQFITSKDTQELGQNVGNILGKVNQLLKGTGENPSDVQQALRLYFAQEAVGAQSLLSRATGAILNPNLELLFNGPSLRPFGFTFRMSPRDETEATSVRKIIRFFKQGMSVKSTKSNVFLQSPNVFDIRYLTYKDGKLDDHPSINRIKTCALLSCDVDYTPDGTYMTYNDDKRTMTSYQLTLRFSEVDPIYEDDYNDPANKLSVDHIGY